VQPLQGGDVVIDHLTVSVSDLAATRAFYEKVLRPLGYDVQRDYEVIIGFGHKRPYLWFKQADVITTPQHIAFKAYSREAVDAFHAAALEAGAKDDGAPGIREHYHPQYYGAFVIDPLNGHPIEAVFHGEPAAPKKAAPKKKAKPAPKKKAKKSKR
jgi:catechol 2,3-dioxygenase-like lactoylglutathione lyase family enzyme